MENERTSTNNNDTQPLPNYTLDKMKFGRDKKLINNKQQETNLGDRAEDDQQLLILQFYRFSKFTEHLNLHGTKK